MVVVVVVWYGGQKESIVVGQVWIFFKSLIAPSLSAKTVNVIPTYEYIYTTPTLKF